MADDKKKKDEIDEDFNQDAGDIREADDTFGLPDIDFNPVTPDEAEKPEEPVVEGTPETTPSEETEEEVDQPYMYASRQEEEAEEARQSADPEPSEDPFVEETTVVTEETYYHTTETEDIPTTDYSTPVESVHEEEEEVKSAYVPGSYASSRRQSSGKGGIIFATILILLLAIIGVWYFVWYRPAQQVAEADKARQEQLAEERAAEDERLRQLEAERQAAAEEAARQAAADAEAAAATPETGTIETISQRTGRYYVVVASAVDGDLAMDYAQKLSKEGRNIKIIPPYGSVIFSRVTIQDLDTWAEAQNVANDLKADYEGVWVKKY